MAEACNAVSATPIRRGGVLRERLMRGKREAIDAAMEHGESWTTKVINGQQGVMLDDIPALLLHLSLKVVDIDRVCVSRDLAEAYEVIVRHATSARSLLFDDPE